jgi:hypothetical protein
VTFRIGVAVLLLLPTAAFAQGNPGPFGGLFGRTPERVGKEYRLFEMRTAATGGFDDAVNDRRFAVEDRTPSHGMATGSVGALFAQRTSRLSLRAGSNATYLQYLQTPYAGGTTVDSSARLSYQVATRLNVDATAAHLYSPYFQFYPQFFSFTAEGAVVPPTSPYVATAVENQSYAVAGGVSSAYSKRSTVGASFERREARFKNRADFDQAINGMRGYWSHQLHRDWQARLGYGRERVRLRPGDEHIYETIDAGINYSRPLTARQRTSFSTHTEIAKLWTPEIGRQYRLNGGVTVTRWMARTWLLQAHAERATNFLPGFVAPIRADNAGASLSGMVSRRAELILRLDAGRGRVERGRDLSGVDPDAGRLLMGASIAQFSVALSRRISLFAQHAFFYYELPPAASPVAPVPYLNRQVITIGLTTWIPIYLRERSPSDTR